MKLIAFALVFYMLGFLSSSTAGPEPTTTPNRAAEVYVDQWQRALSQLKLGTSREDLITYFSKKRRCVDWGEFAFGGNGTSYMIFLLDDFCQVRIELKSSQLATTPQLEKRQRWLRRVDGYYSSPDSYVGSPPFDAK